MASVAAPAAPDADAHTGRRLAYWRGRRKLSQQMFADRLGKSKSWVDKVERGERRLDKFSVLHECANVLQIDVQLLLGKEPAPAVPVASGIDPDDLDRLRAAFERYVGVTRYFDARLKPPPLYELRKAVEHAQLTFGYARYDVLVRALPDLLKQAQTADACYLGQPGEEAAGLLSRVYLVASQLLRKLGEPELARIAADRATERSMQTSDPQLVGLTAAVMGSALLALGRPRSAVEVTVTVAHRIAPVSGAQHHPARLSVYGTLLLRAAMAAARLDDTLTVRELLSGAGDAATLLGADRNDYHTGFGPTNVELHRVAAAVELGEGRQAVVLHERVDARALRALTPERQGDHWLTLARAHAQIGETDNAGACLAQADSVAPLEIRCRPIAREVMGDVLGRLEGAPSEPIAELAGRMGVAA